MGPSNDSFAICGAIFFAALGAMLMATGNPMVQSFAAIAMFGGAVSQWLAQEKALWLISRICVYISAAMVWLALIGYVIQKLP